MLVGDGRGQEGDGQDDDAGDGEEDDAEVQVVDSTYDGGTAAGVGAAAGPVDKLGDHPGQADRQADHQAVEGPLRRGTEGTEEEGEAGGRRSAG